MGAMHAVPAAPPPHPETPGSRPMHPDPPDGRFPKPPTQSPRSPKGHGEPERRRKTTRSSCLPNLARTRCHGKSRSPRRSGRSSRRAIEESIQNFVKEALAARESSAYGRAFVLQSLRHSGPSAVRLWVIALSGGRHTYSRVRRWELSTS
jgi:hypothetical protein